MNNLKPQTLFFIVLGLLLLIILFQNTSVVTLQVLFWQISMSRILWMLGVLLIGFVIGFFIGKKSWDW